jgi:hypothetical protein
VLKKSIRGIEKRNKKLAEENLGMHKLLKTMSATLNTVSKNNPGGAGESAPGAGTSSYALGTRLGAGSDLSEDPSEDQRE